MVETRVTVTIGFDRREIRPEFMAFQCDGPIERVRGAIAGQTGGQHTIALAAVLLHDGHWFVGLRGVRLKCCRTLIFFLAFLQQLFKLVAKPQRAHCSNQAWLLALWSWIMNETTISTNLP